MDYKKFSDEQLVSLAQKNDTEALELLITRYKKVVTKIARSYYLVGGDMDDLLQEGMIGVFKAIGSFNYSGEFKFFAYRCIKSNIISTIKAAHRLKHKPLINYVSLSFDDENDVDKRQFVDSGVKNPEEAYIDSESEIELKNKIFESLSSLESNVLKLYLDGYSYNEISVKIDKNVKTIDNAIQRIRKKLNTALNEEN